MRNKIWPDFVGARVEMCVGVIRQVLWVQIWDGKKCNNCSRRFLFLETGSTEVRIISRSKQGYQNVFSLDANSLEYWLA